MESVCNLVTETKNFEIEPTECLILLSHERYLNNSKKYLRLLPNDSISPFLK